MPLLRSSQRASCLIMQLPRPALHFACFLHGPQRVTLRLSIEERPISVCANFAPGRKGELRSTVHGYLFPHISVHMWPHMFTRNWNNESSLPTVAIQIKLWQFLQWYKWLQNTLFSNLLSLGSLEALCIYIWQLHIRRHNFSVRHLLSNLKLISLLYTGDASEHAHLHTNTMQSEVQSGDLFQRVGEPLQWEVCEDKVVGDGEENSGRLSHSSHSR